MAKDIITVKIEGKIAVIILDNPPMNALCASLMEKLRIAIEEMEKDNNVKVIIITGEGDKVFVAGADIKEIADINSAEAGKRMAQQGQNILNKIANLKKPVIAAINGWCLGGGNELAMACHMRIASDMAKFGQSEINLGIIPGFGGTQRLPRIVGKSKALEMLLTGNMITAKEALRIGLIDRVVPHKTTLECAKETAKRIASKSAPAIRAIIDVLDYGLNKEAQAFGEICETEDKKEGINAFLEKRRPKFQDK